MMRRWPIAPAVALCVLISSTAHGQEQRNHNLEAELHQLREEVRELRRAIESLRAERDRLRDETEWVMMDEAEMFDEGVGMILLADDLDAPEIAALAAIEIARAQLGREQRMELFSQILRDVNDPPMVRNAAYLGLVEAMREQRNEDDQSDEELAYESAQLLRGMIRENAQRWTPNEPLTRERVGNEPAGWHRHPRGPVIVYGRPSGHRLFVDPRHHRFYRYTPPARVPRQFDPRFERHRIQPFPFTDPHWRRWSPGHWRMHWDREPFDRWRRGPEGLRPRDPFDR